MTTCYNCKFFKEFPNYSNLCRKTYRENFDADYGCNSYEPKDK